MGGLASNSTSRTSDSPFIKLMWQARFDSDGEVTITAHGTWDIIFGKLGLFIQDSSLAGLLIVQRALADGIVCYAPKQGKRQLLTLIDDWLPHAEDLPYDEALAKLSLQYFSGLGPATFADYAWWSGLTLSAARRGLEMVKAQLAHERVGATTFWLSPRTDQFRPTTPGVWLLPNYDEFTVGYRDRSAIFDDRYKALVAKPQGNIVFANVIVADGEVVGTWEKAANRGSAEVSGHLFVPLDDNQRQRLIEAVGHCGRLKELPNELRVRIQEMRKAVRDLR